MAKNIDREATPTMPSLQTCALWAEFIRGKPVNEWLAYLGKTSVPASVILDKAGEDFIEMRLLPSAHGHTASIRNISRLPFPDEVVLAA